MSETLDNMPSLSLSREENAALPIPPYPPLLAARQLVGAIYAESGTQSTGGEIADEKLAIGETFLNQAQATQDSPKYNKFGDGTLWGAIKTGSVAVGSPQWNQVMDGTSSTSDLKDYNVLNAQLTFPPTRLHLINSFLAVDEFGLTGEVAPALPLLDELGGRVPIAFNKAINKPPYPPREEKIGRIGLTTFYGFKPGRERQ